VSAIFVLQRPGRAARACGALFGIGRAQRPWTGSHVKGSWSPASAPLGERL